MRLGRVRAGRHRHWERHTFPSRVVEELLEAPGELALGAPDDVSLVGEAFERGVRDFRPAPDRVELVLVLDRAQLLDEPVARDGLDPARVEPRIALEGERRRLEADLPGQLLGQRLEKVALRVDELDAFDRASRLRVAEVGVEPDAVGLDDERRVRAGEAAQVADVRRVRDEERLLETLEEPVYPAVHVAAPRNSSASRYPTGPRPRTRFSASGAITET